MYKYSPTWIFFSLLAGHVPFLSPVPNSQLCTGSPGNPVININFSTGSILPLAPGHTHTSSFCTYDGFYTITGATRGCFNNAWHALNSDHTGGGGIMLVNASYTPGGNGNDIVLDGITFRPCGPHTISEIVGFGIFVDFCEDSATSCSLKADVSTGFSDPAYFWQFANDSGKTWQDNYGVLARVYCR